MYKEHPLIAVMPLYDDEKDSFWMLPDYMRALEELGAVPIMPSMTTDEDELDPILDMCSGFVLTGGHDVSPLLYNEEPTDKCGIISDVRDKMDTYILKKAVDSNKALLGICRGLQIMNVAYGGSLYQDIPSQHPSDTDHHMLPPYDRCAHLVNVETSGPLFEIVGQGSFQVNSYHHQGIKVLSRYFKSMAKATDGLIEGIYMPDKDFIWGVQWHPEFFYKKSNYNKKIFEKFVEISKNK